MECTAIYARFSTELQQDRSIEDQVALCRSYAERNEFSIVEVYDDRARSGASVYGRDGLVQLMATAREQKFDVILVDLSTVCRAIKKILRAFAISTCGGHTRNVILDFRVRASRPTTPSLRYSMVASAPNA